jgi:hypothetical protein
MNTIINILSFRVAPKLWGISRNLFILFSFLFLLACSNDDDSGCVGIDCLPPATTTGEGTFGCLVNGEPFVDNSGNFNCFYQLVDGEYYFGIKGTIDENIPRSIGLGTRKLELEQALTYDLVEKEDGNAFGTVVFYPTSNGINFNNTNDIFTGNLTIKKLDFNNNIISGTFKFQIEDMLSGEIYNITDGRFDAQFTQ